ncbi:MAG: YraN family protein [Rhodospirillales bacterium]
MINRRQRAWRYGQFAETMCALSLQLRGYRVLARRYKTPLGEIDIVARHGRVLAFIEVKARQNFKEAVESISPRQRDRIVRAAELYLQRNAQFAQLHLRFDAMLIAPWRIPRHIRDDWRT